MVYIFLCWHCDRYNGHVILSNADCTVHTSNNGNIQHYIYDDQHIGPSEVLYGYKN